MTNRKEYMQNYFRTEKGKEINRKNASRYYHEHKDDPEFKAKSKARMYHYIRMPRAKHLRAAAMRRARMALRLRVIILLGGKCACCSEPEKDFLELDHIHGGGREEAETKGRWRMWRDVEEDAKRAEKFQLLCGNCHRSKTRSGVCIHKRNESL